jgi:hypothetical protein
MVSAGTASSALIVRALSPRALASSARPISSIVCACRAGARAGNSTWVTAHPEQRARRGRSVTGPQPERSERARAKPQGRSGPVQPGQRSSEAVRSACARCGSSTTITGWSSSHRLIVLPGRSAGQGGLVLQPGVWTRPMASLPASSPAPPKTRRGLGRHDLDATDLPLSSQDVLTVNDARPGVHRHQTSRSTLLRLRRGLRADPFAGPLRNM